MQRITAENFPSVNWDAIKGAMLQEKKREEYFSLNIQWGSVE
jgi:hypothetical protein